MVYRSWKCSIWVQFQKQQNVLSLFPGQTIQHDSSPSLCPNLWCWRSRGWMVLWRSTRLSGTNTKERCPSIHRGLKCKSTKSRGTWSDGKVWLGVQNEAGQRLTGFCQKTTLVIANTLLQKHKRRLYTWTLADGQYQNQIDYILCSQRWRSSIQSTKTRPGADWGSDHELLIANFRLKLKKVEKTTGPLRYDLNWMKNRFKRLDLIDKVPEELWVRVHNIV